jgi:uncharacterized protein (UPF0332 family)
VSFNWQLYLELADELIHRQQTKSLEEAYWRSSISRSYYGVFCTARDRKGWQNLKTVEVHKYVIDKYKESSILLEKQVGKMLDELRRYRNRADYDGDTKVSKDLADRALVRAKCILQNLATS